MHVLFDESNSLVENDAQDEDVKLGLAKKYLLLTHEEGKNPQEGSGPEPGSKKEGQGSEQTGGTSTEPCLDRKLQTVQKQAPETGPRTISEPGSPTNHAEFRLDCSYARRASSIREKLGMALGYPSQE